jgi:transposase-like protein
MAEKALTAVILEAYIHEVSTLSVDDLVKALGMAGVSKSQVSRLCEETRIAPGAPRRWMRDGKRSHNSLGSG